MVDISNKIVFLLNKKSTNVKFLSLIQMLQLVKKVIRRVKAELHNYNSISNQNKRLRKFRNIHKGKDFILLGAGPSLDAIPHEFLENFIVIGTNNTIKYYKPDYWVVIDATFSWLDCNRKVCTDNNIPAFINLIWAKMKHGESIQNEIILHPNRISNDQGPNNIQLKNTLLNLYENPEYIEKKGFSSISNVITEAAVPLALYMGCRNIYLAGVDFYTPKPEEDFFMKPSGSDQEVKNVLVERFQKENNSKKDMWEYKRWTIELINDTILKNRVFNLSQKSSVKKIPKIHYSNVKIQE